MKFVPLEQLKPSFNCHLSMKIKEDKFRSTGGMISFRCVALNASQNHFHLKQLLNGWITGATVWTATVNQLNSRDLWRKEKEFQLPPAWSVTNNDSVLQKSALEHFCRLLWRSGVFKPWNLHCKMTHISAIVNVSQYVPITDGEFKEPRGTRKFTHWAASSDGFLNLFSLTKITKEHQWINKTLYYMYDK